MNESLQDDLAGRLQSIETSIAKACEASERYRTNIRLLAVSKFQPIEKIQIFHRLGVTHFGESYLKEALSKQEQLSQSELNWHYIGKLQSKKISKIVGRFCLIESVDTPESLKQIQKSAEKQNIVQAVLLQVNIGAEATKSGFLQKALLSVVENLFDLPNIQLRGLMCLPPLTEDESVKRPIFREMGQLLNALKKLLPDSRAQDFNELSMGTSHDYALAVEEGATIVRVGSALFGERNE